MLERVTIPLVINQEVIELALHPTEVAVMQVIKARWGKSDEEVGALLWQVRQAGFPIVDLDNTLLQHLLFHGDATEILRGFHEVGVQTLQKLDAAGKALLADLQRQLTELKRGAAVSVADELATKLGETAADTLALCNATLMAHSKTAASADERIRRVDALQVQFEATCNVLTETLVNEVAADYVTTNVKPIVDRVLADGTANLKKEYRALVGDLVAEFGRLNPAVLAESFRVGLQSSLEQLAAKTVKQGLAVTLSARDKQEFAFTAQEIRDATAELLKAVGALNKARGSTVKAVAQAKSAVAAYNAAVAEGIEDVADCVGSRVEVAMEGAWKWRWGVRFAFFALWVVSLAGVGYVARDVGIDRGWERGARAQLAHTAERFRCLPRE